MKILVLSKLSIPALNRTLPQWDYARELGHDVQVTDRIEEITETPDVIIAMGVGVVNQAAWAFQRFPNVFAALYHWDRYSWTITRPRKGEYDYNRYGELVSMADIVFVPSECTGIQAGQWWGIENWHVVRSCAPTWEYSGGFDNGYALCTLRELPDACWGLFEKCCEEIGIPYKMTARDIPRSEYESDVANCRFIVSHLEEMSTGGLSCLEAYYHGKPVLMTDSQWHGGKDYFKSRAVYFKHGDEADFKDKLWSMWSNPPRLNKADCRRWIDENFTDEIMVRQILERIEHARINKSQS